MAPLPPHWNGLSQRQSFHVLSPPTAGEGSPSTRSSQPLFSDLLLMSTGQHLVLVTTVTLFQSLITRFQQIQVSYGSQVILPLVILFNPLFESSCVPQSSCSQFTALADSPELPTTLDVSQSRQHPHIPNSKTHFLWH